MKKSRLLFSVLAIVLAIPAFATGAAPDDTATNQQTTPTALATGPRLASGTQLPWQQALLDVRLETPIASDDARFSLESGLSHLGLRTLTVLRFVPADGPERVFQFTGDPGRVRLDPRWHQAALRFVRLGFDHILDGIAQSKLCSTNL